MNQARRGELNFGGALRLGFFQAISLWQSTVLVFLARAIESLAGIAFAVLIASGGAPDPLALLAAALGAWTAAIVFSSVFRVVVVGGAIRQGACRMRGMPVGALWIEAGAGAGRSLLYLVWAFLLEIAVTAWKVLAMVATLWLYGEALLGRAGGVLPSAALALVLTVVLPLGLMLTLWTELALVRSVLCDRSFLDALLDAATLIGRRFWTLLGLAVLTGLFGQIVNLGLSGTIGLIIPDQASVGLAWISRGAVGILGAMAMVVFEMTRLQAFSTVVLDGFDALARPPEADFHIPAAQIVYPALPVPDPSA